MITQARLKELLKYDPETGRFVWIKSTAACIAIGDVAGTVGAHGCKKYITICIGYKIYRAHRLAWLYVHGCFPRHQIDHIDGDGTNNKLGNLRAVTPKQNGRNLRLNIRNKSGFTGVTWRRAKSIWTAQIKVSGKNMHLGCFKTIVDAVAARIRANKKYGYHENHGQNRPL